MGLSDGYVLDWRATGCQLVSPEYRALLTCPVSESLWRCEVIGPHAGHRWSDHLKVHERLGNGYACEAIGDMTLGDLYDGRRPLRAAEPEPMLGLTPNSQGCKVGVLMITRRRSWGAALVLSCLAWVLIGLPVLACALGWALR